MLGGTGDETVAVIRERRIGTDKFFKLDVFCYSRGSDNGGPMVQCDDKRCMEWFHISCIDTDVKGKGCTWYCKNCHEHKQLVNDFYPTLCNYY